MRMRDRRELSADHPLHRRDERLSRLSPLYAGIDAIHG